MKGLQLTAARLTGHVMLEAIKMTQREFGVASIEMYKGYAEENDLWLKLSRFVIGLKDCATKSTVTVIDGSVQPPAPAVESIKV